MPLAEVKNRLSEVVLSVDDLAEREESLDVMGSTGLLDDIREALAERGRGGPQVLTKDEALRLASGG